MFAWRSNNLSDERAAPYAGRRQEERYPGGRPPRHIRCEALTADQIVYLLVVRKLAVTLKIYGIS